MNTVSAPRRRASPFVALRHRDFRNLWIGLLVSVAGSQMQAVALNWQIYQLTGSALALGAIGLARLIPIVFFSLGGGIVADTRNRRHVLLVTQTILMGVAFALAALTTLGAINALWIYGLSAVAAGTTAFDLPARQSLTPNLVPREHLTNAVTMSSMAFQVATIVGPGLAGILIGRYGVGLIYWLNGFSFFAIIIALLTMRTATPPLLAASQANLKSLREGFRFVLSSRIILSTMLVDFFATFFAGATTLLPIFATDILHVGAEGFGILAAADSAGAVITGVLMSFKRDIKAKGLVLLGGVMVYGLATIGFGLSTQFALSVLFLMLVGAGDTVSMILRSTIRQLVTPDYIRGRMTSINMIFFMGGPQLGEIEAGIAASILGAPLAVALGGVATVILVVLTAWRVPDLRNYRDAPPAEAVGGEARSVSAAQ